MSIVGAMHDCEARGIFSLRRFIRRAVGGKCRAEKGHRFKPEVRALHKAGQIWQCEDCGELCCSEPGPPWSDRGSFLVPPVADGPNCFYESRAAYAERQRLNAEHEAYEAKWRTKQGHDIYLHDEHWACIHLCRSWPDSTPGMEPYYLWVCRRCGEEIRQQIASSFSFGMGQSGPMAYGIQDRFSQPGGLESEGGRVLMERMFHLQSHDVDVEPILQQRRQMQQQIELKMSNVTCQMTPAEIARQTMVFR